MLLTSSLNGNGYCFNDFGAFATQAVGAFGGTTINLKVVLSGTSITCFLNGTQLTTLNTTSSYNQSVTLHGLGTYRDALNFFASPTYDNFRVSP